MTMDCVALWRICVVAIVITSATCLGEEVLQQISPVPTDYNNQFDFSAMRWSGSGDVTAPLQAVDLEFPSEGYSTSGCEMDDFTGFLVGNIALMRQGTCDFSIKAQNAVAAGAVGAIVITGFGRGTLGSPGIGIPVVAIFGPGETSGAGEELYSLTQVGEVLIRIFVTPYVVGPAKVWVGLRNSDAVGLRVDIKVDVFDEAGLLETGVLDNQTTGSSGFNNAVLKTIGVAFGEAANYSYGRLSATVSARKSCSGIGHNSGGVRLWYNGQPIDSGPTRDAGSRINAPAGLNPISDYYLRAGSTLDLTAGSSRLFTEALVDSRFSCPGRPYKELGAWTATVAAPPCDPEHQCGGGAGALKPVPR